MLFLRYHKDHKALDRELEIFMYMDLHMFHAFTKPSTITSSLYLLILNCTVELYILNICMVPEGVIRKTEVKVKQEKIRGDFRLGTIRYYEGIVRYHSLSVYMHLRL